jgi:hypothetical protein
MDNPLIVHISSMDMLKNLAASISPQVRTVEIFSCVSFLIYFLLAPFKG